jgi:putative DNA primase/helicase
MKEEINQRKKETLAAQKLVAKQCLDIWENKAHYTPCHNYLTRKQINEYAIKWCNDDLLVPVCDIDGKIWNLQKIAKDGKKLFVKNGRKKGCMFRMGDFQKHVILCEGYATGASIHQITGLPVIVAFDAYNLYEVCKIIKKKYPATAIYIAADNDCWKTNNTGMREAMRCHTDFFVGIIEPQFKNPVEGMTDFNDLHVSEGKEAVYRQFKFLVGDDK